jgi:hypothetical protein
MRKLLYPLLFLIFLGGCSEDEMIPDTGLEVPVIHGYYARSEAGYSMGIYGYSTPNVKLGNQSNDFMQSEYAFITFPNPAHNIYQVMINTPGQEEIKKIWLVQAVMRDPFQIPAVASDGNSNMIVNSPLVQITTRQNHALLDVTNLPEGYYRIYVKVNNHLLYDNLVIFRPSYEW